jgi:hypothetical protein
MPATPPLGHHSQGTNMSVSDFDFRIFGNTDPSTLADHQIDEFARQQKEAGNTYRPTYGETGMTVDQCNQYNDRLNQES